MTHQQQFSLVNFTVASKGGVSHMTHQQQFSLVNFTVASKGGVSHMTQGELVIWTLYFQVTL